MRLARLRLPILLQLFLAPVLTGQTESVLVPVVVNQFSSPIGIWVTSVAVLNNSTTAISTPGVEFTVRCPRPSIGVCTSDTLPPQAGGSLSGPTSDRGVVLRVPTASGADVLVSAHVGTISRLTPIGGSELPIVRQREFAPQIQIPYIALRSPAPRVNRAHLRIYSLDGGPVFGRILLRSFDGSAFFGPADERAFELTAASPPATPMFAFYDLQLLYPDAPTGGLYRLLVQAHPRSDGTLPSIWAFVTSVDVETHEVTVYRAQ